MGFGPTEFDRAVYRPLGRTERWAGLADELCTCLRDRGPGALRPAIAFDGSRNYEAANRIVKCADGPGPSDREIVPDGRRTRRLDPQPVLIGVEDPQPVLTGVEASACAPPPHPPRSPRQSGRPARPSTTSSTCASDSARQ
ncbi:hypothetical protein [Streptomyces sp. NPDC005303]|uniref:hypothetical protein n=1 Tax=Streptomyces sp. NPDC005303 TaxID=3155713 RepID=UPI00339FC761